MFVVVTLFACWLGWNARLVRQRQAILRELADEQRVRSDVLEKGRMRDPILMRYPTLLNRYDAAELKALPKRPQGISLVRRLLGDEPRTFIQRNNQADALRTQALFPEARIYYYVRNLGEPPFGSIIDAANGRP